MGLPRAYKLLALWDYGSRLCLQSATEGVRVQSGLGFR